MAGAYAKELTLIEAWLSQPENLADVMLLLHSWASELNKTKSAWHSFFHDREPADPKLHGINHSIAKDCLKLSRVG